jgi:hypothetical protein
MPVSYLPYHKTAEGKKDVLGTGQARMGCSPSQRSPPNAGQLRIGEAQATVVKRRFVESFPNEYMSRELVAVCHHSKSETYKWSDFLDFWSAKFYPYSKPGADPVFAVVGGRRVSLASC